MYDTKHFIDRNADSMSPSLNQFLLDNCNDAVKLIYSMKPYLGFKADDEPEDPKQKKRQTAAPKTIWGKFSIQINELMNELAEPLIPNDFNPDKAVLDAIAAAKKPGTEAPCEKCDLHFIRCIKPNDAKVKDFYIHAMTLQ